MAFCIRCFTGDLATVKDKPVTFKEGVEFRLKITFEVSLNS